MAIAVPRPSNDPNPKERSIEVGARTLLAAESNGSISEIQISSTNAATCSVWRGKGGTRAHWDG